MVFFGDNGLAIFLELSCDRFRFLSGTRPLVLLRDDCPELDGLGGIVITIVLATEEEVLLVDEETFIVVVGLGICNKLFYEKTWSFKYIAMIGKNRSKLSWPFLIFRFS